MNKQKTGRRPSDGEAPRKPNGWDYGPEEGARPARRAVPAQMDFLEDEEYGGDYAPERPGKPRPAAAGRRGPEVPFDGAPGGRPRPARPGARSGDEAPARGKAPGDALDPRKKPRGVGDAPRSKGYEEEAAPRKKPRGYDDAPRSKGYEEEATPRKKSRGYGDYDGEAAPRKKPRGYDGAPRSRDYAEEAAPRKKSRGYDDYDEEAAPRKKPRGYDDAPRSRDYGEEAAPRKKSRGYDDYGEEIAPRKSRGYAGAPARRPRGYDAAPARGFYEDGRPLRTGPRRGRKKKTGFARGLLYTVVAVFLALLIGFGVRTFAFQLVRVSGDAMDGTLEQGQIVMVEKGTSFLSRWARGDIACINSPDGMILRRVVALPGENIEIKGGVTYVNGTALDEPYLTQAGGGDYPPTIIPTGGYFVMGDNRLNTHDSRSFGLVRSTWGVMVGKVSRVVWPLSEWGPVEP